MRRFAAIALLILGGIGIALVVLSNKPRARRARVELTCLDGRKARFEPSPIGRSLIGFLRPEWGGDTVAFLRALQETYELGNRYNIEVLVALEPPPGLSESELAGLEQQARALAKTQGLTFPIAVDRVRSAAAAFGVKGFPAVCAFYRGQLLKVQDAPDWKVRDRVGYLRRRLLYNLKLPVSEDLDPRFGEFPKAPLTRFVTADGKTIELSGTPFLLVFFSSRCPHCMKELELLRRVRSEYKPEDLAIVAVSTNLDPLEARRLGAELSLGFPVLGDPSRTIRETYRNVGYVPENILVDAEGRIRFRHNEFNAQVEPVLLMELERLTGRTVRMRLGSGYSGALSCRPCHEAQYYDWTLTAHSTAFESLERAGKETEEECVGCHTVGWKERGGFSLADPFSSLRGVQCESCHGQNGGHGSAAGTRRTREEYAKVCARCHTGKFDPGFDVKKKLSLVDHSRWTEIERMSFAERAALATRLRERESLVPEGEYVGVEACRKCHRDEYESWKKTAHARAFEHIRDKGPECRRCHTAGAAEGVGCEGCHGPGSVHVAFRKNQAKRDKILSFSKRCEDCVLVNICTRCHDRKNDPGFELDKKLPSVRH